jgi:DNA segregation ATPase FtsK/SpoIIIE-like protein
MNKFAVGIAAIGLLIAPPVAGIPQLTGTSVAEAQNVDVSINVFFDRLGNEGRWVRHRRHNYVWIPVDVDPDWAPYTRGRWEYTDRHGWYFQSREPYAWAVYHYGRWGYDTDIGWFWVPGTRWAPAWVSWRRGGEYVGWAPLPPEDDGYVISLEIGGLEPPPGYWVYVPVQGFAAQDLLSVVVDRRERRNLYRRTEFLGPVVVENNIVINTRIDIDYIRENNEEEIEVREIRFVDDPAAAAEDEDALVAFEGEIEIEEDVAPPEVMEPEAVEAPTEGQEMAEGDLEEEEQPAEEEEQPADGEEEEQPAEEEEQPAEGEEQPTEAEEQPAEGEEQPTEAEEQPAEAEEQPTEAEEQPAEAEEQPADGEEEEQPADGEEEEQPAEEEEQPAEGEEQPTNAEEQPAEAEEQPADGEEEEQPADGEEEEQPAEEEEQPAEGEEEQPAEEEPVEERVQEQQPEQAQPEQAPEQAQPEQAPEQAQPEQAPEQAQPEQAPEQAQPEQVPEQAPEQAQPEQVPEQAPAAEGECPPEQREAGTC